MTSLCSHRPLACRSLGLPWILLLCATLRLAAQTPEPKQPAGYVRVWNMVLTSNDPIVVFTSIDPSKPLLSASPVNVATGYTALRPGRYTLRIFQGDEKGVPAKTIDANVTDKSYQSILVTLAPEGHLATEVIDETPDPEKPSNQLTVRQFCPGAQVVISAGSQHTAPLDAGQTQVLDQMPDARVPIFMRAVTAQGPRSQNAEFDFRLCKHGSLFVFPDAYGRIRLRTSVDGISSVVPRPGPSK